MNENCIEKVDPRDIFGEYDPPIPIVKDPTKEQKEAAKKIIEKYEKLAAEKRKRDEKHAEFI